jgi:diacylglycerol kinase (ATP)
VAYVILNPYANRWIAKQREHEVVAALKKAKIDFELVETEAPEHAIQLSETAARQGKSPIIAAGGDGTIGEVVNGLYRTNPKGILGPFGVLPLGTANDLLVNLGNPIDLDRAAEVIAGGKTRTIDLCQANSWVFANNSAIGLEPIVSLFNIRMKKLRGLIRYLVAALRAIASRPQWEMRLRWDDGSYEGPVSLVSVGNCPLTGGLFRMAPSAKPDDGLLTFVHGYAATRLRMLSLLPRAISGEYVKDPAVHQYHSRQLEIDCVPGTPIQADGEIRALELTHISYRVLPACLKILTL